MRLAWAGCSPTVGEPVGDVDWLYETMRAMNEKSDPTEEERKGGSGHIGKMIISINEELCCSMVAYVPPDKTAAISAKRPSLLSD